MREKDIWIVRENNLKRLGFRSYRAYLKSDMWRAIRARVWRVAGSRPRCTYCSRAAKEVHHLSYSTETLRGDNDYMLTLVCRLCHEALYRAQCQEVRRARSRKTRSRKTLQQREDAASANAASANAASANAASANGKRLRKLS